MRTAAEITKDMEIERLNIKNAVSSIDHANSKLKLLVDELSKTLKTPPSNGN